MAITNLDLSYYGLVGNNYSDRDKVIPLTTSVELNDYDLLLRFASFDAALRGKVVNSIKVCLYVSSTYPLSTSMDIYADALSDAFDPRTVTYNTMPSHAYQTRGEVTFERDDTPCWVEIPLSSLSNAAYGIEYGFHVRQIGGGDNIAHLLSTKPYLVIDYDPSKTATHYTMLSSPAEGASVPYPSPATFSWRYAPSTKGFGLVQEKEEYFRWRVKGSSSYQEIKSETAGTITVPPNTFPPGEIEWQVSVLANDGSITESAWRSALAADAISSAAAISPDKTFIDGSVANVFRWEHITSTGTAQTRYDLQICNDSVTWETLLSDETSNTYAEIPANTLPSGILFWRVRTYNSAGVAGSWSAPAQCTVISAPRTPMISVTSAAPCFSIRWEQSGQQAYEITLDGTVVAKKYGEQSSYRHEDFASPGHHTIQVRIQNRYGLWSAWGTADFTISNTEGSEISLSAKADVTAGLFWSTAGVYSKFVVYRNDVKIAETEETEYIDHFSLGRATYHVRGVSDNNGNFTQSNEATVDVAVPCIMIAAVDNPVWQKLKLSAGSLRITGLSASRSVTYLHRVGASLPSAEIGEAVNMTYSLDCAFRAPDMNAARAFEALLGKLVCVKEPGGERYIGVLDNLSKESVGHLYRSYTANIALVDWEEGAI